MVDSASVVPKAVSLNWKPLFYESKTCADLHNKETGLYLYGDMYVADEFMLEKGYKQ